MTNDKMITDGRKTKVKILDLQIISGRPGGRGPAWGVLVAVAATGAAVWAPLWPAGGIVTAAVGSALCEAGECRLARGGCFEAGRPEAGQGWDRAPSISIRAGVV